MTTAAEIIQGLRERPMSVFQWLVAGLCLAINTFDGFDVLAMSFVAPAVANEWGLSNTELGGLFSAGLFGMMVGALTISPLADSYGRRTIILGCLTIMTVGMIGSAMAPNALVLAALRFLTGIGIGGMLASINTMVAEFANAKRRDLLVALYGMGFAVGSIGGGLVASYLLHHFGWREVFMFGGAASALLLPLAYFTLPESIEFLVSRQPKGALQKLNKIFRQMKQPALAAMPPMEQGSQQPFWSVFGPGLWSQTLLVCGCFAAVFIVNYFAANWTPKLIVDLGYTEQQGIAASIWLNTGGSAAGLILGFLGGYISMRILAPIYMVGACVSLIVWSFVAEPLWAIYSIGALIGFFGLGAGASLYMIVPRVFPPAVRVTGTGVAIGIGRIGAIVGPGLPGLMIDAGFERPVYYTLMALPILLAAVFVLNLRGLKNERKGAAAVAAPEGVAAAASLSPGPEKQG